MGFYNPYVSKVEPILENTSLQVQMSSKGIESRLAVQLADEKKGLNVNVSDDLVNVGSTTLKSYQERGDRQQVDRSSEKMSLYKVVNHSGYPLHFQVQSSHNKSSHDQGWAALRHGGTQDVELNVRSDNYQTAFTKMHYLNLEFHNIY